MLTSLNFYTDGSYKQGYNMLCYGFSYMQNKKVKNYVQIEHNENSTSNRAELKAVNEAIKKGIEINKKNTVKCIKILTDSTYCINVIDMIATTGVIKGYFSHKDLLLEFLTLNSKLKRLNIDLRLMKVKAHSGIKLNDHIDKMLKKKLNKEIQKIKLKEGK